MPDTVDIARRQKQRIRRRRFGAVSTLIQPPFDTAHNTWSFDPDAIGAAQYITGPTGTVTTPVKTQATPSFYTYGSTDFIDFGNNLSSTWTNATGFTLYCTIKPSSGDLATANQVICSKGNVSATVGEFQFLQSSGILNFFAAYAGSFAAFTKYASVSTNLVAGTRYVVTASYDPTLARDSRCALYVNGTAKSITPTDTGVDGVITAGVGTLRLGVNLGAVAPPSVGSYAYAYNTVHSAGTVASITSWLQTTKGWV